MLTDPGRMHAKLLGIECLGSDVDDELIRSAGIVLIMVVTEREIPEVHGPSSWSACGPITLVFICNRNICQRNICIVRALRYREPEFCRDSRQMERTRTCPTN